MEDQVQRDLIEAAEHLRELRAVKAAVRVKTAVIADHDVRKIAVSDRFLRPRGHVRTVIKLGKRGLDLLAVDQGLAAAEP